MYIIEVEGKQTNHGGSINMKKKIIIPVVIIGVIVLIVLGLAGSYNKLVKLETSAETAFSDVQVQLQRRSDLVPNLVNTVKGYAAHETEVFTAVSDARAKLAGAATVDEINAAEDQFNSALSRLLAISESYPELKANENFLSLQDELAGTENRIGVARKDYNSAVQTYNTKIRSFPTNIFAGVFGFEKKEQFTAAANAQSAPNVSFE